MEMWVVVLGLLASAGAQEICPRSCHCSFRSYSKVARCTELDPAIQRFPSEITSLVVMDTPMEEPWNLSASVFLELGLRHVRSVDIVNSSLGWVDPAAFAGLEALTDVNLANNRLTTIPASVFANNTEIRRVRLAGNPLSLNPENHFLDSETLVELDLSNCSLYHVSHETFKGVKNLEVIDLSHNKIKEVDSNVFESLLYLDKVDLSFNEIEYIGPDTFTEMEEMVTLNLNGNPLSRLEELLISDLRELDASNCKLSGLFSNSLEGVPQLTTLNLSNNNIETIESDAFDSVTGLTFLYLSNNKLKGPLHQNIFQQNQHYLEVLSFSGNSDLKKLDPFIGNFAVLHYYDVSRCGLKEISNLTFSGMHSIATLNVSSNLLEYIEPKTFSKLKRLTILDLSDNMIRFLHPKLFSSNGNLQKLYLGNNFLHRIPATLFVNTMNLYTLDVRNNRLSFLWNVSESSMMKSKGILRNLVYLNVAGNRLKKLHLQNFMSLKKLGQLDISDNPLECSSGFGHVLEWLLVHRVVPNRYEADRIPSELGEENPNTQWDLTLKKVCPRTGAAPSGYQELRAEQVLSPQEELGSPGELQVVGLESSRYIWPLTLVAFAALSLVLALGNIAFLMVYKARRSAGYRQPTYKSHYPNPLAGLSQVRTKHAPAYHKLYEDCSVPNTPIVRNSSAMSVVTCIADHEKAEAV